MWLPLINLTFWPKGKVFFLFFIMIVIGNFGFNGSATIVSVKCILKRIVDM